MKEGEREESREQGRDRREIHECKCLTNNVSNSMSKPYRCRERQKTSKL